VTNPIWTITGGLATGRRSHTATLLADGKVLVAGGADASNSILESAELYDPTTETWTSTGALHIARTEHAAALLMDGRVLVSGGRSDAGSTNGAELYDPATRTWTPTANLSDARGSHTATLLRSGHVLVAGGTDDGSFPDRLASAELYDPATATWSVTGSLTLNRGRTLHTATLLEDGTVLVVGGTTFGPLMAAGAELYQSDSGTWAATANPSTVRVGHTATLLPGGKVLVVGGVRSNALADQLDSVEVYDPVARRFAATGSLNTARTQQTATLLQDGKVLVAGGFQDIVTAEITHSSTLRSAELYDPDTEQWSATVTMNVGRGEHSAILLGNGAVIVAGGSTRSDLDSVTLDGAELFSSVSIDIPGGTAIAGTPE
jgi:hypothetical protein